MRRLVVAAVWVLVASSCWSRAGAAPIPRDPDAPTSQAFMDALTAHATAITLEAYLAAGHRDAKWDEDVITLLGGTARWMAGHEARPRLWDLVQVGWRAKEAGCRDPMVEFCYGYMLEQYNNKGSYVPLRRSASSMQIREYGNLIKAMACVSLAASARSHEPDVDRAPAWELATAETVEAIEAGELDDVPVRVAAWWLGVIVRNSDAPPEHAERVLAAVAARDALAADPWLLHVLRGQAAMAAGYRARGSGFANTVTEEGWKILAERTAEAAEHYLAAWEVDPTRPEPAAYMVTVCGLGDAPDDRDARDWFDEAVALEMDFNPAYAAYLNYLQPRWHGGLWEMIEFGRECAATERYDTVVPFYFITGVSKVADDTIGLDRVWDDPDLYDLAIDVARRMATSPTHAMDSGKYVSAEAAIAWLAGATEEASRLMQSIGDNLDRRTLWVMEVDSGRMIAEVKRFREFTPY